MKFTPRGYLAFFVKETDTFVMRGLQNRNTGLEFSGFYRFAQLLPTRPELIKKSTIVDENGHVKNTFEVDVEVGLDISNWSVAQTSYQQHSDFCADRNLSLQNLHSFSN